jgi:hypothetical protein
MSDKVESKELRVVLDAGATNAYEAMVARMKEEVSTIKVQPSQFVSFLVADFMAAHFEKDKAVFIAEFFDSDGFHEAARRKAKGSENYEDQMDAAIQEARRIKDKKRNKVVRKGRQASKESEALTP